MLILTTDQEVALSIAYEDASGNAATVDGAPVWEVSDENLGTLEVSEDGFSATLIAVGSTGTFQASVTADADLGEGVRSLVTVLDVEVVGGEAVVGIISTGSPTSKFDDDLEGDEDPV